MKISDRFIRCFKPTYKGWKLLQELQREFGGAGFKPTYKGWKLVSVSMSYIFMSRFKPTYKGWKRGSVFPCLSRQSGFKPTYKGWKLLILRKELKAGQVLSLPTRDGNAHPRPLLPESYEF